MIGLPRPRLAWRGVLASCLLLGLTTHSGSVAAQVNVEVLRNDLKQSGFGSKLDASFSTFMGNTQGITLGASALIGFSTGRHLAYLNASGNYSHLSQETQVSNSFVHARYNLRLNPWLLGELFGQLEADRFRRIALRRLLGVGPRFEILDLEHLGICYGMAYMLEHTELSQGTQPVRPSVVHRFSNYATITAHLDGERVELSKTVYYQPRFDEFGDYRLLSVTGLDFEITGVLSAGIMATLRFEDPTPLDVKRTDFSLKNTLGVEF